MLDISDKLKNLRTLAGFTQTEIAEKLGITKPTYIGYEKGKDITINTLFLLAKIYNISFLDFFTDTIKREKENEKLKKIPIIPNFNQIPENVADWMQLPISLCQTYDYAIFAKDNSMFPKIDVNNLIVIHSTSNLKNGDYGVFKVEESYYCRIFLKNPITGVIFLKPLNPTYNIIEIEEKKEFEILGRVICSLDYNF